LAWLRAAAVLEGERVVAKGGEEAWREPSRRALSLRAVRVPLVLRLVLSAAPRQLIVVVEAVVVGLQAQLREALVELADRASLSL
jgi:hypothetical protein